MGISTGAGYSGSLATQLKMARDALLAQQSAMNTLSHNVANANTEGYHRQRVTLTPNWALEGNPGMYGSGVRVDSVDRSYNHFITSQERTEMGEFRRWETEYETFARVEEVLNELNDFGITDSLDEFWNSWEDLANDVDSVSARVNVSNKGDELGRTIQDAYLRLDDIRKEINISMQEKGDEINRLSERIAQLNDKIAVLTGRGQNPNDLLDQRDQLIKELAGLANITIQQDNNNTMSVYIGNEILVQRGDYRKVEWTTEMGDGSGKSGGYLSWSDTGNRLQAYAGDLYGLQRARDSITEQLGNLDELADTLRTRVNELHMAGIGRNGATNTPFFTQGVTGARSLTVNSNIGNNPELIAASTVSATGDNSLAHDIYNVQFEKLFNDSSATASDFYQAQLTKLGNRVQIADTNREATEASLQQAENWQQHFTGVNLDEEMSQMITIQYAFQAASKVSTTVDEMMMSIIGLVR